MSPREDNNLKKQEPKQVQLSFAQIVPLIVFVGFVASVLTAYMKDANGIDKRVTVMEVLVKQNQESVKKIQEDIGKIKEHILKTSQ